MVTKNRHRARTADATFAKSLMAYLGEDITLPDNTVITAMIHEQETTNADDYQGNVYENIRYGKIPTVDLGTLAAGQTVTYDGALHYIPTLQPTQKGWTVFTLERE